jgi:hypothetical protein
MNSQIAGLLVASVVFGLMDITHSPACYAPRGNCGWLSDAIVAKCGGLYHSGRSESLDVETRSHAEQMKTKNPVAGVSATIELNSCKFDVDGNSFP